MTLFMRDGGCDELLYAWELELVVGWRGLIR